MPENMPPEELEDTEMSDMPASTPAPGRGAVPETTGNKAGRVRKQKTIFEAGVNKKNLAAQTTRSAAAVAAASLATSTEIQEMVQALQAQLGTVQEDLRTVPTKLGEAKQEIALLRVEHEAVSEDLESIKETINRAAVRGQGRTYAQVVGSTQRPSWAQHSPSPT
jgi:uncharacterized protein (DUF3084 family)